MKEIDQEWIEKYFAGELTEAERAILESRMVEDPIFKNEVEQYQLIIDSYSSNVGGNYWIGLRRKIES
ncbi:MAG: hypothetical protein IPL25_13375 [Saprospiraceae bacterium]|nr:hypothetical protein [Candidatus Vicinibacter affinis]